LKFDKTPLFNPKRRRFGILKKKDQTTRCVVTVHCLSRFCPKITAQGGTFKVHLMPHMSTKIDNTCIKMVTWHPSIPEYGPFRPINMTPAPAPVLASRGQLRQSFPTDLTTHDAHFEPTVGILPSQTRGRDLSLLKTKCPSSTFYKYGRISWLEQEENQVQSQPKTSHFPWFLQFFSLSSPSLSTVAFGHHHSYHHRFITVSTTSGRLNSSLVAK